jgi:hypothetical protein
VAAAFMAAAAAVLTVTVLLPWVVVTVPVAMAAGEVQFASKSKKLQRFWRRISAHARLIKVWHSRIGIFGTEPWISRIMSWKAISLSLY